MARLHAIIISSAFLISCASSPDKHEQERRFAANQNNQIRYHEEQARISHDLGSERETEYHECMADNERKKLLDADYGFIDFIFDLLFDNHREVSRKPNC